MAMTPTDKHGKRYLKLSEAKAGQIVTIDDGFTCARTGRRKLQADDRGKLYFRCGDGKHFIHGQADDGIHCVGIYPA